MGEASLEQERTEIRPQAPTRKVGRYAVLTKLATGGMAEIFLARQTGVQGFEKLVALKQILPSYASDPDFVEMFFDEARVAALLSHPAIVQIYDVGQDGEVAYIAMEYLAGESLAQLARAAKKAGVKLPLPIAVRLVSQAAEALDYAHRKTDHAGRPLHIVHRDVSPQNLFVTYDGSLKVLDFGIAKAANRASHTSDGRVKGKLAYMAPEQARGKPLDARSDVWALGVVLHELVTGTRLFAREDPALTFGAVVGGDPVPSTRARNPEVPSALDQIILRTLERDPERRTASAAKLHEELEGWLRSTNHYPSAAEIAELMRGLFSDQMRSRAALVERAAKGEEISGVGRGDTEGSMPGGTPASGLHSAQKSWLFPAIGGIALALATLVAVLSLMHRNPAPQQVVVPVQAAPAPAPTLLKISTDPPHGVVTVDGIDHGPAPLKLSGLAVGAHALRVVYPGRPELTRTVTIDRAGESLDLLLSLPPPVPAPAPVPAAPVAEKPKHVVRNGKLTLQTIPWTHVYLGDKSLGDTPLVAVSLPAGTHQLRLENAEKHVSRTIEITINPGELTTEKLHL